MDCTENDTHNTHIVQSKMSVHVSVQCMFVFSQCDYSSGEEALGKKLSLSLLVRDLMQL